MKLALIIDDYLPDSTRVGAKMFHELAVELIKSGHQVTVITPAFSGHKVLAYEELDGVRIWRFKSGPIKDINKAQRAINETLLSFRAWNSIKRRLKPDTFDGLVYYSPSIFWGYLVKSIKNYCNCPAYLVLRDLFPQWAIDAGMLRQGSLLDRYFRFFEHYSYKQADQIGLMSERNLKIFSQANEVFPCEVLRNWADISVAGNVNPGYVSIRDKLALHDKVIFFYGGNIGHAQDMANLMRLARNMLRYDQAHFLFIGQGDEVGLIKRLAVEWQLNNFSCLPSVDQKEFQSILGEIDVGLFSLAANHTSHNFPGKLLGYMANSLPILGSVNRGNDLLEVVNESGAGIIHINGEDSELFKSAEQLLLDVNLRKRLGMGSFELLKAQFSVQSAARTIEIRLRGE